MLAVKYKICAGNETEMKGKVSRGKVRDGRRFKIECFGRVSTLKMTFCFTNVSLPTADE